MIDVKETDESWELHLADAEVGQVSLGRELKLVAYGAGGVSLEITISTPFRVVYGDAGTSERVDPQDGEDSLGQLIVRLRQRRLSACVAQKAGTLTLVFADDLTLDVPPDEDYEAWSIDSDPIKIVAIPGDELSIWRR